MKQDRINKLATSWLTELVCWDGSTTDLIAINEIMFEMMKAIKK